MSRLLIVALLLSLHCGGEEEDPYPPTWRGIAIGESCEGDGECGAGLVEASGTRSAICSTMPGGSAAEDTTEICDDLDNDCNGVVDDLPGAPAADLQEGVCAGELKACTSTGDWLEPDYTEIAGYEVDETTCDELDNDCDGEEDEGCPDCSAMDSNGIFPNCDSCPDPGDCDQISSPSVNGYACGCSPGCPCGLSCGSITIGPGITMSACTR